MEIQKEEEEMMENIKKKWDVNSFEEALLLTQKT